MSYAANLFCSDETFCIYYYLLSLWQSPIKSGEEASSNLKG